MLDVNLFIKYMRLKSWLAFIDTSEITLKSIEGRKTYLSNVKTPRTSIYFQKRPTLSASTIQSKITALKSLVKFLNLLYNECIDYKLIEQKKIKAPTVTVLTDTEYKSLFDWIDVREKYKVNALRSKLLVQMWYTSWMRLSEMLKLKIKDVLYGSCQITWKWNKDRRVFFAGSVKNLLNEYIEVREEKIPRTWKVEKHSDNVFISHNSWYDFGNTLSKNTVCDIMKRYSDNLNIWKRITCHSLRHTYATKLLESWLNIREIQELLGHSDIQTTERYCHVLKSDLQTKVSTIFS